MEIKPFAIEKKTSQSYKRIKKKTTKKTQVWAIVGDESAFTSDSDSHINALHGDEHVHHLSTILQTVTH